MPLSKVHNTLTSDHILLDGTDSTSANANSKVLLDASASNTDVGSIMSFESGAGDSSVTNTSTFLDDIKTTNRTAGRKILLPSSTTGGTILDTSNTTFFGADQWRLTTTKTGTGVINANWERIDYTANAKVGTGMSESSGIFSFPSTGIYLIEFTGQVYQTSLNDTQQQIQTEVTTDDSSYTSVARTLSGNSTTSGTFTGGGNTTMYAIIDVTDVSNTKVRFNYSVGNSSTQILGASDVTRTGVLFTRLGDT
jgi:hypothetical protein